jgi:hypothetical protein
MTGFAVMTKMKNVASGEREPEVRFDLLGL